MRAGKSALPEDKRPTCLLLTNFLSKYGISEDEFKEGNLRNKGFGEIPKGLPWSNGLQKLDLSRNQITDVSSFSLPDGLQVLYLHNNQITDVSSLSLPDGLQELYLSDNLHGCIVIISTRWTTETVFVL